MVSRERGKGSVTSSFDVLIDSDAFVGIFLPHDSLHNRAVTMFASLKSQQLNIVTTSWVIAETATVLSYRDGQDAAHRFLDQIATSQFDTIHITESLQEEAAKIFRAQQMKRTSMVDCGNMAVAQHFAIPKIFAFDEFYKRFPVERLL